MCRYILFILLFVVSCSKPDSQKQENTQDSSASATQKMITNGISEVLSPEARTMVEPWGEFTSLERVLSDYYNISPADAIANANELARATQQFRDSIRVERFNQPDLKIRLNVLHNTALRLEDMSQIPKISDDDIAQEVNNLINTFSSITIKLNNIVQQKNLENELREFSSRGISN